MGMGNDVAGATLTPGMPLDPVNPFGSLNGMASPFSVFGGPNGQGLGDMSTNLDWVRFSLVHLYDYPSSFIPSSRSFDCFCGTVC